MKTRLLALLIAGLFSLPALADFGGGIVSTLTRPANTTAYNASTLVASSATAGSVVVPSFTYASPSPGIAINRVRLWTNVTTGWDTSAFTVRLWSSPPTYTNGDGGTYAVATGTANHLATFTCTLSQGGDGAYGSCAIAVGSFLSTSNSPIYWDLQYTGSSALTPISGQVFTITPEFAR